MKRLITFCSFIVILAFAAMWFAEDSGSTLLFAVLVSGKAHWWISALALMVFIALGALGAIVLRRPWWAGFAITIVAVCLALVAGQHEQARALGECIGNAPFLQRQLDDFHRRTGRYPEKLAELGRVPCNRFPRGRIIEYSTTPSGYRVQFHDWLMQWEGTEREPITARK